MPEPLKIPTLLLPRLYSARAAQALEALKWSTTVPDPMDEDGLLPALGISLNLLGHDDMRIHFRADRIRLVLEGNERFPRLALHQLDDAALVTAARAASQLIEDIILRSALISATEKLTEPPRGWRVICLPHAAILLPCRPVFTTDPVPGQTPQSMVRDSIRVLLARGQTSHDEMAARKDARLIDGLLWDHERAPY